MRVYENKTRFLSYVSIFWVLYLLLVLLFFSDIRIDSYSSNIIEKTVLGLILVLLLILLVVGSYVYFSGENHIYFMCDEKKLLLSRRYVWQLQYFSRDEIESVEIKWEAIIITFLKAREKPYRYISAVENWRKTWKLERSFSNGYTDAVVNNHPKRISIKKKYIKWNPNISDIYLAIRSFYEYSKSWS